MTANAKGMNGSKKRNDTRSLPWNSLLHWFKEAAGVMMAPLKIWGAFSAQEQQKLVLHIPKETVDRLTKEWRRMLAAGSGSGLSQSASPSAAERELLERCSSRTKAGNRNNVTRTAAYWEIYRSHPELHWALLAHMVSRNGGWSMTDLQGELLPRLLEGYERKDIFAFLERANALIFQDAYPQLLLYAESKRLGRPLFHLLHHFHISRFMTPVWQLFWEDRSPVALTVCLIINEQNYIEGRIVRNGTYKKQVLDTLAFQAQSLLQLNQVVFPYKALPDKSHRVAGRVLEDFSNLKERIGIGKALYGILFSSPSILRGVTQFAERHPHTGSRADYNPTLFSPIRKAPPSTSYTERLNDCGLKPGAYPLYSPSLQAAWKDQPIGPIERYDWFSTAETIAELGGVYAPETIDVTEEACTGLKTIELAVLAAQAVGLNEEP